MLNVTTIESAEGYEGAGGCGLLIVTNDFKPTRLRWLMGITGGHTRADSW